LTLYDYYVIKGDRLKSKKIMYTLHEREKHQKMTWIGNSMRP